MQKGANNPLTRKVGPLPVYAYALAGLAVWFVLARSSSAKASSGLPYTGSGTSSAAQQPASGQGNPADNGNADLLAALGSNALSVDALLSALQQGGGFGVAGGGGTSGGGASTASVTAPTVDSGTNNAPVTSYSTDTLGTPTGTTTDGLTSYYEGNAMYQAYGPGYGGADLGSRDDAYAAQQAGIPSYATQSYTAPVASPTPTVVQPAPVDTSSVIAPAPTILKPGATNVMA